MTSVSTNVYIDKLYDIMNKYNNTYRRTIKMKPVDITSNIYIDFTKKNNKEGPKFKVGYHVGMQSLCSKLVTKLYFKYKGYDNSFNSWIDKKHIV